MGSGMTGYDDDDDGDGRRQRQRQWRWRDGRRDTRTTAKTMAADDEDNEVDGDGVMGDGATGEYGDDNDYGDGRQRR